MANLVILGTDTDAGKTTFALLWMAAFGDRYAYWKPVETGPSDSQTIARLVRDARIFPPLLHLDEPGAPSLAARRAGTQVPPARAMHAALPKCERPLLIETFGGPLSPLNESELQIEFIRLLDCRALLVGSSRVGAVGRALATVRAVQAEGLAISALVLIGPRDEFAESEIAKHSGTPVFSLQALEAWNAAEVLRCVTENRSELERIRSGSRQTSDEGPQRKSGDFRYEMRDRAAIWHPYTPLRGAADPLPVAGARDEFLELEDRRRIIDGISSWWTILHGHRPPHLMAALREASTRIDHVMFAGLTHSYAIESAELLLRTAPWKDGRVFFSDNGSTAVEVALKMAYQFWCLRGEPQRRLFVGLDGCYHGDTFGAMAVSRDPVFFGRFEPLLFECAQVPVSPERLENLLSARGSEVAAVIVEPLVQGAGGIRLHSPEVLGDLYALARKHGVLFIADEVMTACRTGTFWAHTQAGIAPDLICAAKTLAGGVMPLAATLAAPHVVAKFDVEDRTHTFFHGHSFTAHPLACAVAAENLRQMATGGWLREAERIKRYWSSCSEELANLNGVADVRVCGTILALDVGSGGYLAAAGAALRAAALGQGVLLRPLGHVLYAMPPLCTSDESLEKIVGAMKAAVRAVGKQMIEYVAITIALLGIGAVAVWLARFRGRVFVVRIIHGEPKLASGRVSPAFVADVADVIDRHGLRRGTIRGFKKGNRVSLRFSRSMPPGCRQAIRNVWGFHLR